MGTRGPQQRQDRRRAAVSTHPGLAPGQPWFGSLLGGLLVLVLIPIAQAREPAARYGEDLLRADRHWEETFPAPLLAQTAERLAAVQRSPLLSEGGAADADGEEQRALEAEVRRLETRFGPYASGLGETLRTLAQLQWERGRAPAAQELLQRALHVTRVNGGLYSPAQRDTVAQLLSMQRLLGDFEALDARYDYFFRLYGSGGAPLDALSREATLEYLRWQREALRRELERGDERLLSLHALNRSLIERLLEADSADAEYLQALALSQLKNLYLVEARVEPMFVSDPRFGGSNGGLIMRRQTQPSPLNGFDMTQERLLSLKRSAYPEGRRLLEDVLERMPPDALARRAQLLRELGDWHQWHGVLRPARESYAQAIALLREAGAESAIESGWGEPVELPDNGVFVQPERVLPDARVADDAVAGERRVLASFEVSASGRAQRVELRSTDGEPLRDFRVARSLRAIAFRPVYREGEPVDSRVAAREYRVLD